MYGDQQDGIELDLTKLIPPSVIRQFEMSAEMWDEKIRNWWANNSGMSREDAEEEFLCFSEELDMYGLQYYPIRVCLIFSTLFANLSNFCRISGIRNCFWVFRLKVWAFMSRRTNFHRDPSSRGLRLNAFHSRIKWLVLFPLIIKNYPKINISVADTA